MSCCCGRCFRRGREGLVANTLVDARAFREGDVRDVHAGVTSHARFPARI